MSKIKIHSALITPEEKKINVIMGILQDNKIIYKEDNIDVTILIFDNKIELNRINEHYQLNMCFVENKETNGSYIINNKMIIDLKTKTNILRIQQNKIVIEYELKLENEEMGTFNFEIEYEVI